MNHQKVFKTLLAALSVFLLQPASVFAATTVFEPLVITAPNTTPKASKDDKQITDNNFTNQKNTVKQNNLNVDSGTQKIVLSKQELSANNIYSVADLATIVPSLTSYSSGGLGQQQNIFFRGSDRVTVMINSIELLDPSSIENQANYQIINLAEYDRVEILKDNHLSGNNVSINLINDYAPDINDDSAQKIENIFSLTQSDNAKLNSGYVGKLNYKDKLKLTLNINQLKAKSQSAVVPFTTVTSNVNPENFEKDAYDNSEASLNLQFKPSQHSKIQLFHQEIKSKSDYDQTSDPDDATSKLKIEQSLSSVQYNYKFFDNNKQEINLFVSDNKINRNFSDSFFYQGQTSDSRIKYKLQLANNNLSLIAGYKVYKSPLSSEDLKEFNNKYFVIADTLKLSSTELSLAYRIDEFSKFKGKDAYKFGIQQNLYNNLALYYNQGEGLYAPSIFQLSYGATTNLKPESIKNNNWGLRLKSENLIDNKPSYFFNYEQYHNKVTDQISYGGTYPNDYYFNNSFETTHKGYVLDVGLYLDEINTQIAFNQVSNESRYTNQTNQTVVLGRRPEQRSGVNLSYFAKVQANPLRIDLKYKVVGVSYDKDVVLSEPLSYNYQIPSYQIWDLATSFTWNKNYQFNAEVKNLFDKKYFTSVASYSADGSSPVNVYSTERQTLYLSMRLKF